MMVPEASSGLAMAMATLEKVTPVTRSTLSRSISFCVSCTARSGLSWSSSLTIFTGTLPSLPPFCSSASMKPSYWSWPSAAAEPDMVARKPILTSASAPADATASSDASTVQRNVRVFMMCLLR